MKESVALIKDELNLGDVNGVFICDYEVFKRFYQLQRRRAKRDGSTGYIVLISLELEEGNTEDGMNCIECLLKECFREEDVACRYSESQFLMIFPDCHGDIEEMLNRRLGAKLEKNDKWKDKIRLGYGVNRMTE